MKKEVENEMEDELLSEYDFAQMEEGVKGKYVERYSTSGSYEVHPQSWKL
jgi:hypothetical protein